MLGRPPVKHDAPQLFAVEATPTCIVCGETKPASEFSPDARRASGCMSRCKICQRLLRNEWSAKYPASHLAAVRRWRAKNVEKVRLARRRAESRRRARKAGVEAQVFIDPTVVFARASGICGICGNAITGAFHVDHIIPLAKGGPHTYANVQASHPRCNLAKGAK